MPTSGGSVTDNSVPTNKVVDGKSHYLAYITPDEGKSLVNQGGVPTMTNEGIMAYPPQDNYSGPSYSGGNQGSSSDNQGSDHDIQDLSQVLDIMGNQKLLHLHKILHVIPLMM